MRWGICVALLITAVCLPGVASAQVISPPSVSVPTVSSPPALAGQLTQVSTYFYVGEGINPGGPNTCGFAVDDNPITCDADVVFTGSLGNPTGYLDTGCGVGFSSLLVSFLTVFPAPGSYTITATVYQCTPVSLTDPGVPTTVLGTATATIQVIALPAPAIVDPVPDLLSGPVTASDPNQLIAGGRPVQGVVADGVTQVVIEAPRRTSAILLP